MSKKTAEEIREALAKPFAPEDLEWRLQMTFEDQGRGIAVPYVTNRAIQNRLDEVVGPENWYNSYEPWHGTGKKEAQICGISIHFEGRGFITKWDGAEDSDIEPIKGGLSDSMKRAAVQWGIGRVLYGMNTVFVDIEKKGKSWVIKDSARKALNDAYLGYLKKLGLEPAASGGSQTQLIPKQSPQDPKEEEQPAGQSGKKEQPTKQTAPKQEDKPTASQAQSANPTPAEDPTYMVISAKVQGGMSGANTHVVLEGPDKKRINAYVRGAHPELSMGLLLTGVQMDLKKQDTVVFFILKSYRIIPRQEAA